MAWLAVNKKGEEYIFPECPDRTKYNDWLYEESYEGEIVPIEIELPKGSIKKLIGRDLTWDNDPVELEWNNKRNAMETQLFNVFTEKQIKAIKDCIRYGLWGDTCCTFYGDEDETDVYGYCTGKIYKGGNFSNRQISGICSGISKVIREQKLNWIFYDADAWGDNSGGMLYFHCERMNISTKELREWAEK